MPCIRVFVRPTWLRFVRPLLIRRPFDWRVPLWNRRTGARPTDERRVVFERTPDERVTPRLPRDCETARREGERREGELCRTLCPRDRPTEPRLRERELGRDREPTRERLDRVLDLTPRELERDERDERDIARLPELRERAELRERERLTVRPELREDRPADRPRELRERDCP